MPRHEVDYYTAVHEQLEQLRDRGQIDMSLYNREHRNETILRVQVMRLAAMLDLKVSELLRFRDVIACHAVGHPRVDTIYGDETLKGIEFSFKCQCDTEIEGFVDAVNPGKRSKTKYRHSTKYFFNDKARGFPPSEFTATYEYFAVIDRLAKYARRKPNATVAKKNKASMAEREASIPTKKDARPKLRVVNALAS